MARAKPDADLAQQASGSQSAALRPRAAIPLLALILTALALVVLNGAILLDRVGASRGADIDNRTWVIAQLEVDHKELRIALLEAQGHAAPNSANDASVRRAFDIYYSRLMTVAAALKPERTELFWRDNLGRLEKSRDRMAVAIDSTIMLGPREIQQLTEIVDRDSVDIRRVTSEALKIFTQQAEAQRHRHRDLLIRLGLLMGLLVVLMAVAVIFAVNISREATSRAQNAARTVASLRRIFEASLDGVLLSDPAGTIVYLNAAARHMFGQGHTALASNLFVDTILPTNLGDDDFKTLLGIKGEPGHTEIINKGRHRLTGLHNSGRAFPIEVSISSDHDLDGRPVIVAFLRDITEEVQAEFRLREARDQARSDANAKGRFLAVMSHEMRTPLHGVLASLDLIEFENLTRTDQNFLKTARACGLSALDQVDEVLELTRSGATEVSITAFDPRSLVAELMAGMQPLAIERGNQLFLAPFVGKRCPAVYGWRRGFQLVLRNLISNAVKFTRNGDIVVRLECSLSPDGRAALVAEVQDTGVGIDPADHDRVFCQFETADDGNRDGAAGVGLGLAIARSAVERMGGKLEMVSARGVGTKLSFRLLLDIAPEEASHPNPVAPSLPSQNLTIPRQILVVDDNPVNLVLMAEMLRRLGHIPETALDGPSALALAQTVGFDLILMDIGMPGMDGLETTRAIREGGESAFTPIVGVTALSPGEDREHSLDAGMQDVLSKPLRIEQLRVYLADFFADHVSTEDGSDSFAEARDLMGDETMARLFRDVLKDVDSALVALHSLKTGEDLPNLRHLLHRAGGSAAVIGAPALSEALLAGERSILAHDMQALRHCELEIVKARKETILLASCNLPTLQFQAQAIGAD